MGEVGKIFFFTKRRSIIDASNNVLDQIRCFVSKP